MFISEYSKPNFEYSSFLDSNKNLLVFGRHMQIMNWGGIFLSVGSRGYHRDYKNPGHSKDFDNQVSFSVFWTGFMEAAQVAYVTLQINGASTNAAGFYGHNQGSHSGCSGYLVA